MLFSLNLFAEMIRAVLSKGSPPDLMQKPEKNGLRYSVPAQIFPNNFGFIDWYQCYKLLELNLTSADNQPPLQHRWTIILAFRIIHVDMLWVHRSYIHVYLFYLIPSWSLKQFWTEFLIKMRKESKKIPPLS